MENTFDILTLKQLRKLKHHEKIGLYALIIYLCADPFYTALEKLIPESLQRGGMIIFLFNFVFLLLVFAYYYRITKLKARKTAVWGIYLVAVLFITFSVLLYPQYSSWFLNSTYGIPVYFLDMTKGFFALLFFSMVYDRRQLVSAIVYSMRLNYVYYLALFVVAMRRGYWGGHSGTGEFIKLSYNLTFGYNVAFCGAVFYALYVFRKKKTDLFLSMTCAVMALLSGSRGSIIGIAAAVILSMIYSFRSMKKNDIRKLLAVVVTAAAAVLIYYRYDDILQILFAILRRLHISSRSLQMMISGQITEGNGREQIWKTAGEMIRNGGFFGYGFYGDRMVIGQRWFWGYPHDIFLEMLIQFGIPLGGLIILTIGTGILHMGISCSDPYWVFLYIVLCSACTKLLISDSFWYCWQFWALLGVLCAWSQQSKKKVRIVLSSAQAGRRTA